MHITLCFLLFLLELDQVYTTRDDACRGGKGGIITVDALCYFMLYILTVYTVCLKYLE